MQQKEEKKIILNSKVKDSGGKLIFGDSVLCAQFVRGYVDLPYMKDVKPEDIEDVSEQFVTLFEEERNADRVKRIQIRGEKPFFIVSLIEHKTGVEYDVCMQIFRYMICIWDAYAKEEEKKQRGVTRQKDFKYPLILPIVYYEGKDTWTAPLDFINRIEYGEVFGKFIPNFEYYLVPICKYSNMDLLEKADEISLIMLVNKLQTQEDIDEFKRVSEEQLEEILKDTPKDLVDLIANVLLAFLLKANVPTEEAQKLVGKVKEKKMAELFENAKINLNIDVERRKVEEQKRLVEELRIEAEEERQKNRHAIQLYVSACREFGIPIEEIKLRLKEQFHIEGKEADAFINT